MFFLNAIEHGTQYTSIERHIAIKLYGAKYNVTPRNKQTATSLGTKRQLSSLVSPEGKLR
jgi:hypothetical protein